VNAQPNDAPVIPGEILAICKRKSASILIKGTPGSGKSSLALEIASSFEKTIIVTSGRSANDMKHPLSWLKSQVSWMDVATWFGGDGIANTTLAERVRVLGISEKFPVPLLVFDDLESFMLGLPRADILIQNRLFFEMISAKFAGVKIIISESCDDTGIEACVDCILALHDELLDGRPIRWLEILKIAGARRGRKMYPFTLTGGRFSMGNPIARLDITNAVKWIVSPDPPGSYSTGSEQLDALYKDCLKMGTFNVFEIDPDLPSAMSSFFLSAIINFLHQKRGVIVSVVEGINTILINKREFMLYIDAESLNDYYRLIEEKTGTAGECRPYVIQVAKREKEIFKTFPEVYDALAVKTNFAPILAIMEYTAIDFRNDDFLRDLSTHIKLVKNANIIEVALINAGVDAEIRSLLVGLGDTHVKFKVLDTGVTLFTGQKPWSNHFIIELASKTMPKIKLVEVT